MISKKLIQTVPEANKHIKKNVLLQLVSLVANIYIMWTLGSMIEAIFTIALAQEGGYNFLAVTSQNERVLLAYTKIENIHMDLISICCAIIIRFVCAIYASIESHNAAKSVKLILREKLFHKMMKLGNGYTKKISTAEVLQVTVEGVDQLEIYFGNYLPQFFYAMLAPVILFVVVTSFSFKTALVLFLCVPLIPISIVFVQKFAKKLLAKYWGEYTGLGDNFLENLQGLNTLKIYGADEEKHKEMNIQAERFRKITMRVLTMQLNSISVMDIMAYGGTALGIVVALREYYVGNITLGAVFVIILLCSDFFLPMRLLGSFFHVAMNGMAASKKIFTILDMEEPVDGSEEITGNEIQIKELSFAYDKVVDTKNNESDGVQEVVKACEKLALKNINMEINTPGIYAIVGESGCGKSTLAGILSGNLLGYEGQISVGNTELSQASGESIRNAITVVGLGSYLFKGTVRENLIMGNPQATEEEMWSVLEDVKLAEFLKEQDGLNTKVTEKGSNFSGGQCQRFALARALLHSAQIYIFDEATSNIDVESENQIMSVIKNLGKEKPVILISHRLANVVEAKKIWVLNQGELVETGDHQDLLEVKDTAFYKNLWNTQQELENFSSVSDTEQKNSTKGGNHES